eukprot:scaffold1459_cov104-Isochrysis_galbana.AAC.4
MQVAARPSWRRLRLSSNGPLMQAETLPGWEWEYAHAVCTQAPTERAQLQPTAKGLPGPSGARTT